MYQKYKYIWYKLSTKSRGLQGEQLWVRSRVRKSSLEGSGRWYVGELLDCWRVMDSMDWVRSDPGPDLSEQAGWAAKTVSVGPWETGRVVKASKQGRCSGQKCEIWNIAGVVRPKEGDLGGASAKHESQSKCSDLDLMLLKSGGHC